MELVEEVAEPELVEVLLCVDEDVSLSGEAGEEINLMDQRDILDNERVGCHDRLAGADWQVIDATERDHWRAHPFGSEARERLRVTTLGKCRHGQHLGCGHDALATAAVETDLKHGFDSRFG